MIEYKQGDIFKEDVEAIVNTVNCIGIMGRGLALQFKKKYPDNFKAYITECKKKEMQLGKVFIYQTNTMIGLRYIINFPTKHHWRSKSSLQDIKIGLESLIQEIKSRNITSLALPPLGCGLGGLKWNSVKSLIEKICGDIPNVRIVVFEPQSDIIPQETAEKIPLMTSGRAALVVLIDRYLQGLLDPFITLLELHKLMYFMQEAGENLRLTYKKGTYGPYAENLRHVLKTIEGHMITGYGDGDDTPGKELELIESTVGEAKDFLKNHQTTLTYFDKVATLVEGFETPFGLELLSTVHWIATKEGITSKEDLSSKVHAWNERKKQFTERQIHLAFERLKQDGWINQMT